MAIQLNQGGSGTGISYYSPYVSCPQQAHFIKAQGGLKGYALDVGNFLHQLLEHYYTGGMNLEAYRHSPVFAQADKSTVAAYMEAENLFRRYRLKFEPDEFGTDIEVELPIKDNPDVDKAVGISPFTCKIDMVLRISEEQAGKVNKARNLDISPGTWLLDHKTAGYLTDALLKSFDYSYQFAAYQVAYKASTGIEPNGMLVNIIVKGKNPRFLTHIVPYPSREQIRQLHYFLSIAKRNEQSKPFPVPSNENCFGKYPCQFLDECQRRTA